MIPTVHRQPGFPACVQMRIAFNDHAVDYETAAEWAAKLEQDDCWFNWVSHEERQKAIDTDSIWTCQWYPDTPVGFCGLAASTFDALMARVNQRA